MADAEAAASPAIARPARHARRAGAEVRRLEMDLLFGSVQHVFGVVEQVVLVAWKGIVTLRKQSRKTTANLEISEFL